MLCNRSCPISEIPHKIAPRTLRCHPKMQSSLPSTIFLWVAIVSGNMTMLTKFERKTLHPLLQYCQELLLMEEIPLLARFFTSQVVQDFFHRQYQLIQPRERNLPPESRGKSCRIVILNRTPEAPPQHTATTQNEHPKNDKAPTHQPHQNGFPNKIRKDQTKRWSWHSLPTVLFYSTTPQWLRVKGPSGSDHP